MPAVRCSADEQRSGEDALVKVQRQRQQVRLEKVRRTATERRADQREDAIRPNRSLASDGFQESAQLSAGDFLRGARAEDRRLKSIFVITAYTLEGKALTAYKRRRRKKK